MLTNVTFIHAADLHLDSPFCGLTQIPEPIFHRIKESTFASTKKMFDLALKEKVDFILLSGDLFDEANRSLKAQLFLRKQFIRLQKCGIEVFVIFGNHDHLGGDWTPIEWPNNVHIFSSKTPEEKSFYKDNQLIASIYGYSYPRRVVTENQSVHYKKSTQAPLHIGMIHGTLSGVTGHDPYCPFSFEDLIKSEMDYLALGHIHKRQVVSEANPAVIYPGNIQSRHMKETGEKGCYLVRVENGEITYEFKALADVLWDIVHLDVTETNQMTDLFQSIEHTLNELKLKGKPICVKIVLVGETPLYLTEAPVQTVSELLEVFREQAEEDENFVWLTSIEDETENDVTITDGGFFFQELIEEINDFQEFNQILSPLLRHPVFRRHVGHFFEEDFNDMEHRAKTILKREFTLLQKEGGE